MPCLEGDTYLAVGLESADTGSVPCSGIDDDEGALAHIDFGAIGRHNAYEAIVHRSRQPAPVHDKLVAELEDMRRGFGRMFRVALATLPHHVPKQDRALACVDPIGPGVPTRVDRPFADGVIRPNGKGWTVHAVTPLAREATPSPPERASVTRVSANIARAADPRVLPQGRRGYGRQISLQSGKTPEVGRRNPSIPAGTTPNAKGNRATENSSILAAHLPVWLVMQGDPSGSSHASTRRPAACPSSSVGPYSELFGAPAIPGSYQTDSLRPSTGSRPLSTSDSLFGRIVSHAVV